MSRFTSIFMQKAKPSTDYTDLRNLWMALPFVKILLETRSLRYFLSARLRNRPADAMARLHAVHLVIGGDNELVQGVAVDAKRRRADANADARETIPAERH